MNKMRRCNCGKDRQACLDEKPVNWGGKFPPGGVISMSFAHRVFFKKGKGLCKAGTPRGQLVLHLKEHGWQDGCLP